MARHPTARRVHRQDKGPDDAFVAGVLETTAWAQQHRRTLIIGAIAVVAAFLLIFILASSRASKNRQANDQLLQVRAAAMSGNNQLAIRDLEQYVGRFGGTAPAGEARLLLGRAYLQESQPQKTIDTVRGMADDLDDVLGVNAALLLAAAHEAAGQSEQAVEVYLRVADNAEFLYQKQEALDNAARVRLDRGDARGAAELYDRILSLTPETDGTRQVYELRAGEARAAAGTAGTATGS